MPPQPLAPLDPHRTRVLSSIYAPRKLRSRPQKTAPKMLDNSIKSTLSPFHPLPAIGQKLQKDSETKIIVFDLNKNETYRAENRKEKSQIKLHDILKPLTPLRIHGFTKRNCCEEKKPLQLLRENTYEVIEPVFVHTARLKRGEMTQSRKNTSPGSNSDDVEKNREKVSPKTRFKNAALQVVKLASQPETGKLLSLRERETFNFSLNQDKSMCRLQELPQSPAQQLSKLSEIFQNLEMKGRHRDRMKKENSWF